MNEQQWLARSERWLRILLRLYPADFRDEMGHAVVHTYRERCSAALRAGGVRSLIRVWLRALWDSLRNGPGERVRPAVSWRRNGNWGRDLEIATRRLVRAPLFMAAMVGTLTVGLGAFAVVYAVVQNVLIAPMAYERPDDLYFVWRDYGKLVDLKRGWLAGTDVAELAKSGGVIEEAAGLLRQQSLLSMREGANPIEIASTVTTPNLFDVLGVRPAMGRGFTRDEIGPARTPVIVLTHALWNRLGADSSIVGKTVWLTGQPFTVIGVMPRDFTFVRNASLGPPEPPVDAYTTLAVNLAETNPGAGQYAGLIRVGRDTPPAQVAEAVSAVGRVVDTRDFKNRGLKLYPTGLKADLVSRVRPALVVLGFAGVFLVLVLMVNVATLLLARASKREQEFAVSRALGANSLAIVRATLLEGGLLGLVGGAGGALVGIWATGIFVALAPPDLPRREAIVVNWGIALVVIGVGALLGLLAAIAPALWASRASLSSLLASSAVRGGGGHQRMRRAMVVAQIALSLVLLSAGGLVVRSFERLLRANPGFNSDGLLTMRVPIPRQLFPEAEDARALQERVHVGLASLPGITAVGAATTLPMTAGASQTAISVPGAPGNTGNPNHDRPLVDIIGTRAGYVEVMGMRVLSGRAFNKARRDGVREAIVDRAFANYFFPTGSPVGATATYIDSTFTIVGVVEQARLYDLHKDARPQVYLRAEDWDFGSRTLSFAVRTSRSPDAVIPDIQAIVRRIDPRLTISQVRAMNEIVDEALSQQRLGAVLIGGFAIGALLLAAMGLFGVVSGSVTRRRHELAMRLVLGADHGRVLRLVLGEGVLLVGLGVLIGLPGVYAAGTVIRGVLVGVSPSDPVTLVAVAVGLTIVSLAACYLPARRVLDIDPAWSLRL
ncbi:MAG TPA: ADOP family duplicated permease [Vicinamibacterales bacterium]|nr:ADOP family duplicated permease [Vicinamibacterales bacterium]